MLDGLIEAARAGRGAALMLTGESGIGKTALLDHAAGTAAGLIVTRVTGVESETELPYAALHQLCGFLLEDGLDELPPPRRDALRTVFGLRAGSPPELFRAGLAVRDLLARAPTVCLVDDAQWLDRESAQVLGFVARRLRNHPVTMVFAAPSAVISDISEMSVRGVRDADARALLAEVRPGPLDERVRDQILAEARGNPGALLGRSDVDFRPRIERLTPAARLVLLVAAADPTGDAALVGRAVRRLGRSLADADDADLLEVGGRVAFRHPAARTAAYRAATPAERRRAHGALAEETDPRADPDRRAWHRGQSLADPDEDAAAALAANAEDRKSVV